MSPPDHPTDFSLDEGHTLTQARGGEIFTTKTFQRGEMGYMFLWLPEAECSEGSKSQKCLQPLDSMVKKDHPVDK